jgi:hypothetical protein
LIRPVHKSHGYGGKGVHKADQDVQIKNAGIFLAGITVDFSEPPSKGEAAKLRKRRDRLDAMRTSVGQATWSMRAIAGAPGMQTVNVRNEFVDMGLSGVQLRGDPSDRRLSVAEDRPPAARLITPRGAALRLFLTALFEAQSRTRPGQRPGNTRPLATRDGGMTSWIDLIATAAEPYGKGKHHMSISAKKTRQLQNAIDKLVREELAELTRTGEPGSGKYEGFVLMHEGGRRPHGPNVPYHVPVMRREQAFPLPATLFTRGWIHVLEDSELAFILMIAATHQAGGGNAFGITAETRLLQFGMKHDGYEAHIMLSRLGLVTVTPDDRRRPDGTVEEFNSDGPARPHMLSFTPAGFDRDAFTTLTAEIDRKLGIAS